MKYEIFKTQYTNTITLSPDVKQGNGGGMDGNQDERKAK